MGIPNELKMSIYAISFKLAFRMNAIRLVEYYIANLCSKLIRHLDEDTSCHEPLESDATVGTYKMGTLGNWIEPQLINGSI